MHGRALTPTYSPVLSETLLMVTRTSGDYRACQEALDEALVLFQRLGDVGDAAHTEANLAQVLLLLHEFDEARLRLATALPVLYQLGDLFIVGWALHSYAFLALRNGNIERATRLCAACDALHERIGYVPRDAVQELAQLQVEPITSRRGEPAIEKAWTEGQAMTLDEAVAYALADAS